MINQSIDQLKSGGLARSAAPEQDQDLAAGDGKTQVLENFAPVRKTIRNVKKFDGWLG
jgi:hypothetical protein